MLRRKLGFSDLELTTVGFGAWAVGGGNWDWGWGVQDDRESIEAIHKAIDLGINWIDTAAAYGLGHSEEMVGKAIRGKRDQIIIATKCSLVWEGRNDGTVGHSLKAESVKKEAEDSLRRLGVDVIDLYQIHWPNPEDEIEEGWACIAKLIEEGKVRYGGVSNFNIDQIKRLQKIYPVASLQPEYSMLERSVEDGLLGFCHQQNIGVIVYSPLASGLLTGKYNHETVKEIHPEDWRLKYSEYFNPDNFAKNIERVEKLRKIADRFERSVGELAIAWVLRRKELTAAIVGSRRASQIAEIGPASEWVLSAEVIAEMEIILG